MSAEGLIDSISATAVLCNDLLGKVTDHIERRHGWCEDCRGLVAEVLLKVQADIDRKVALKATDARTGEPRG